MKCKLHPHHTGDGVCGTCLHDRLLPLVSSGEHSPNRKSDSSSSPPPLSPPSQQAPTRFPRSVSPYLPPSVRKTKTHFFCTPQTVPTTCSTEKVRQERKGKFSFLYSLFGHSSKDKAKSNSSSSWWMQRFMRRGKRRKCHVDDVEPIRRCSARAAMPAGLNLSWKLADTGRF